MVSSIGVDQSVRTLGLFGTVCDGSNFVDLAEWPQISLLNRGFESMLLVFRRKGYNFFACSWKLLAYSGAC